MIDPELRLLCFNESKQLSRPGHYGPVTIEDLIKDADQLYVWITKNREHYDLTSPPGK